MSEDQVNGVGPSSSNESEPVVPICISSMTGQRWVENISRNETVLSLKEKVWRRCGLLPYHQGLIFGEKSLPENNDSIPLVDLGIRRNSMIRLVLVTRSGPMAVQHPIEPTRPVEIEVAEESCSGECWDGERVFSEDYLEENRRTLFKMCELRRQMRTHASATKPVFETTDSLTASAPEDTSAKESSAGDTECDEEKISLNEKVSEVLLLPPNRSSNKRERHNSAKADICEEEEPCTARESGLSARDRLLIMMQSRAESPSTDLNAPSEDGSEFSSGMIICDLSNEFRRLRVRRKHHMTSSTNATQKAHTKSKPKPAPVIVSHHHKGSDLTSSDDERPSLRRALDNTCAHVRRTDASSSYSAFRRPPAASRGQRAAAGCQSHHRCYACASKFNSYSLTFHCRCGKKFCSRHRPAEMHTCARLRKMQDVSD